MIKKKGKNRIILVLLVAILLVFFSSGFIYADDIERTDIVLAEYKMYDALKNELYISYRTIHDQCVFDRQNKTISIPTESIPSITEINLESKEISDITGIEKLTGLTKINLGDNSITNISPIENLNQLIELELNGNNLGNSASSILETKTKLKVLNISNTGINNISFLSSLNELQELKMASNSLSNLSILEGKTTLRLLDVSGNTSVKTIESILRLTNLKSLNISGTGIDNLELDRDNNIGIYNLTKLEELYLSGLNVSTLSPVVKSRYVENHHTNEYGYNEGAYVALLNNIVTLDISYINRSENTYVSIPSFYELQYMENLTNLYMQGNRLTSVYEIYRLKNLKKLNLKDNKITDLSGMAYLEYYTDQYGNSRVRVKDSLGATSIDLSNNEISNLETFSYLNKSNITYLNLSGNHIYNTSYVENIGGELKLQEQSINMQIYKKAAGIDQYILLLPIMQGAKNPSSKLYDENASYETYGCTLNPDAEYQSANLYNVIISKDKTKDDTINLRLHGGIADDSIINYIITNDSYSGIDSLVFNDSNLNEAIYQELNNLIKKQNDRYLARGGKILNVNHEVISRVQTLDLSNMNIADLTGLQSFDNLRNLDISKNENIPTLSPIQYCLNIQELNASETSVGDNISAIENFKYLKVLVLNNVGMTKIDAINNLTDSKIQSHENLTLLQLDVSANNLNNIVGVEKITSLTMLSASDNHLSDIPDLDDLVNLEKLSMYGNSITKIPKIANTDKLRYVFFSNNKLTDISELNKLTTIIDLDLSNNILDDNNLKEIKNIKVSRTLKISGNNITSLEDIKSSISSVIELDISKNMIQDVSIIDSRFAQNGTLVANNQRIAVVVEDTGEDTITINLPQIFVAAKTQGNKFFYTEYDFETTNCQVSGNSVIVNLAEIGENIATVKIIGNKADGTTLSIVPPIRTSIIYDPEDWTNQNVSAIITFTNRNKVAITNNDGNNQYEFANNGEFTFEYVDEYGVQGSTKVSVNWIDKEKPVVTGVTNLATYTDPVSPVITDNKELSSVTITKDNGEEMPFTSGTEISELGEYVLKAKDHVNNETIVNFTIKEVEESIESDEYEINDETKIITNIQPSTTITNFKANIEATTEYTIKDKNGEVLSNDSLIGTGCIISTSLGDYKIIVKGDSNGDGKSNMSDILVMNKHRLNKEQLKDEYLEASDVNGDKSVNIQDILQINKYRLGKINSL